ncbi:hypothetical protein C8Q70DRAFT_968277 [Cubamyces menziesii]|nr:hypothetical protein C8Q70DRAFT_968277 [Cubamyces menziesii]
MNSVLCHKPLGALFKHAWGTSHLRQAVHLNSETYPIRMESVDSGSGGSLPFFAARIFARHDGM